MWPGHWSLLLGDGVGGQYYKSHEHIGAEINRERDAVNLVYYSLLQFQNSDFAAGVGDERVGAAE